MPTPAVVWLLSAILSGTISDPGRHGVRAADVKATNLATHSVYSTKTDRGGKYSLEVPAPGSYSIEIKASGFEDLAVKDPVKVEARHSLDVALKRKPVQEFRVMNGDYNPQAGRVSGVNVNPLWQGGAAVHGALYDTYRNSVLDANNFQNNHAGIPRTLHIFNNLGAQVNGPLRKSKVFYTLNYETLHDMTPNPKVATVPTMAERQGGFWNIPASHVSAVARNLLAAMPAPNLPGEANNYVSGRNAMTAAQDTVNSRLDANAGKKQHLFVAVNHWGRTEVRNDNGLPGILTQGSDPLKRSYGAVALEWAYTRNPTTVFNVRLAASRYVESDAKSSNQIFDFTKFGFAGNFSAPTTSRQMTPAFIVNGYTAFGQNNYTLNPDNTFLAQASVSKTKGRHQVRAGAEARLVRSGRLNIGNPAGWFYFDSLAGFLGGTPASGAIDYNQSQLNSWRSCAFWAQDDWHVLRRLNLSYGFRWDIEGALRERYNRVDAGFDPNAISPINAAVRAAYARIYPGVVDKRDLPTPDELVIRGGLLFSSPARNPYRTYPRAIQPRLGMALRLNAKTVMRAGIGSYYTESRQFGYNAGFQQTTNYQPPDPLGNPYPNGIAAPTGGGPGLLTGLGQQVNFDNPHRKLPRILQYSVVVQRELRGQANLEVVYNGNHTYNFFTTQDLNAIPRWAQLKGVLDPAYLNRMIPNPFLGILPATTALGSQAYIPDATLLRAFPEFDSVNRASSNDGTLWFNSLQVRLNKRLAKSLTGSAAYVYGKSMERYEYQNQWSWDGVPARATTPWDMPHTLTLSFQYEPPLGRLFHGAKGSKRRLTTGWQIQQTATYNSGMGVSIPGAEYTGVPVESVDHRWITAPTGDTVMTWFNTYNFSPDGVYSAARTLPDNPGDALAANSPFYARRANALNDAPLRLSSVRTPNAPQVNLACVKDTKLTEHTAIQLRLDSYNLANTPIFPGPNTDPTNPALFGTVPAYQVNPARTFQAALRLTF